MIKNLLVLNDKDVLLAWSYDKVFSDDDCVYYMRYDSKVLGVCVDAKKFKLFSSGSSLDTSDVLFDNTYFTSWTKYTDILFERDGNKKTVTNLDGDGRLYTWTTTSTNPCSSVHLF